MAKLFSYNEKKILNQVDKPESELNKFICQNWLLLFSKLIFIKNEFVLEGNVRTKGSNGRIDILAYNPETKKFIIFELKKNFDKNITDQASDYRDFIEDNFAEIYLLSTQKYGIELPKYTEIQKNSVEIILIAKNFSLTQIDRVKKNKDSLITLIKYFWFENDLIFIDYINNDPEEDEAKKIVKKINNMTNQDPNIREIEAYFSTHEETSKTLAIMLYEFLKAKDDTIVLKAHRTKLAIDFAKGSFTAIGYSGKGSRKCFLQLNTDFDIIHLSELIFEDRFRGVGVKPKGSLGNERYEIFFQNFEQMQIFIDFLELKV